MTTRIAKTALWLICIGLLPIATYAHRDDYLNETFVYQTLDRGELEVEYWFDYHQMDATSSGHYQHTASMEYGFTGLWMADFALNFGNLRQSSTYELSRWRVETRRRFGEEGSRTPDIAASLELEGERTTSGWDYDITPRLVLSHDISQKLNLTLNLFASLGLEHSATASPGYNLGIRYPAQGMLRIGAEVIQTWDHELNTLLIPQIWILPWPEDVLKIGYAKAYGTDERYFVRIAFEAGIG